MQYDQWSKAEQRPKVEQWSTVDEWSKVGLTSERLSSGQRRDQGMSSGGPSRMAVSAAYSQPSMSIFTCVGGRECPERGEHSRRRRKRREVDR
eukprot:1049295-Rhodomonas_salina.2